LRSSFSCIARMTAGLGRFAGFFLALFDIYRYSPTRLGYSPPPRPLAGASPAP
jgi:hypothetical protein